MKLSIDFNTASRNQILAYFKSKEDLLRQRIEPLFPSHSLKIEFDFDEEDALSILATIPFKEIDDEILSLERTIDLKTLTSIAGDFVLHPDFRHNGLGRKIMYGYLEYLKDMGMRYSDIFAGGRRGAYSWGKFGYELTGELEEYEGDTFDNRLKIISSYFHIEKLNEIKNLLPLNSDYRIKKLISFTTQLTPLFPEAETALLKYLKTKIPEDILGDAKNYLDESFKDLIKKYGEIDFNRFPFGEFILQGLGYNGQFDLENEQQWQTARAATYPELFSK